ncbi:MAG: hypothetical protein A3E82_06235 [Gammaproteobacteria bacterium RIFCSPHIGHO2_12_FULL_38_11]|nr:MAG: hypothetical protein A3E82_06235 [Gammaproteobacteria bacterium RIFCSPHIGHO2_12_FULL_38_11]
MIFIETTFFTKYLPSYLTDDEYSELQDFLMQKPDAGALIKGTGGLRKLRWPSDNKGKRGGVRIIYYWQTKLDQFYMMTIYGKNEMSDLSSDDKKELKKILARW